jgi:hypothetical protein
MAIRKQAEWTLINRLAGRVFVPLIKNASFTLWRMPAYSHEHDILGDHRPFDILANPFPPYCSIQNLIGSACWRYKSLH